MESFNKFRFQRVGGGRRIGRSPIKQGPVTHGSNRGRLGHGGFVGGGARLAWSDSDGRTVGEVSLVRPEQAEARIEGIAGKNRKEAAVGWTGAGSEGSSRSRGCGSSNRASCGSRRTDLVTSRAEARVDDRLGLRSSELLDQKYFQSELQDFSNFEDESSHSAMITYLLAEGISFCAMNKLISLIFLFMCGSYSRHLRYGIGRKEALTSKFLCPSTGIFCQQIPEYEIQVSCSNVHHVELILVFLELLWKLVGTLASGSKAGNVDGCTVFLQMRKLHDHAFLPKMEKETNPQRSRQKSVGSENSIAMRPGLSVPRVGGGRRIGRSPIKLGPVTHGSSRGRLGHGGFVGGGARLAWSDPDGRTVGEVSLVQPEQAEARIEGIAGKNRKEAAAGWTGAGSEGSGRSRGCGSSNRASCGSRRTDLVTSRAEARVDDRLGLRSSEVTFQDLPFVFAE
ncbi:hypothetical protein M5K25_017777 [Dendrobium thyrsiflorum]|uniref:Uncharacterized protein n=1 Tax=Dendrobium thyrsiflorum TaxID=117978 RepID=A0ABD0UGH7_DENTH